MKKSQFILAVTLLAGGLAYAGTYEKMVVTPEPLCGPWYVSAYGGGTFNDDAEGTNALTNAVGSQGLSNGWMVGGAVGLRTDKDWRFELDLSHNQSPFDLVRGEIERTSLMVNAVKEFPALQFLGLTPYLGAGVGLTSVEMDAMSVNLVQMGEADEMVLGYQFSGGLVYDLTECLQFYAEYRLIGNGELEDVVPASSLDMGWTQAALLGVRWFF